MKAFNSVDRREMIQSLSAYRIPDKIVKAIGVMYTSTGAKVLSADCETEPFGVATGVMQGDTLAPLLFIIVLFYVIRCALEHVHLALTLVKTTSRKQHIQIQIMQMTYV